MQVAAWSSSFGHRLIVWLRWLCVGWLFLAGSAFAQGLTDPAVQRGVAWLQGQIQASGQLASEAGSPALPMQVRSEAAITLRGLAQTVPPALYTAIEGVTPDTTEYLARKAIGKQLAAGSDAAHLDALIKLQNADGGFGAAAGLASNAQDTAWALRALAAGQANSAAAVKALGWLISVQQGDGQWKLVPDGDAVVTTALAVHALNLYRQQPAAQAALVKARAWLTGQRNASQRWADDLRTAHALFAVLPGLTSASSMQAAVDGLRQSQMADGSWAGDGHLTALALRALWLAAQPITNPDMASVTGMLLDSQSRAPLSGFTVHLRGPSNLSATVNATGTFEFTALAAGPYTLEVPAQGEFRALRADIILAPGQRLDVGQLLLKRNANPATATVLGKVTRSDTGAGITGATIQVGVLTTHSGADGSYQLLNVPPGDVTVSVSAAGFRGAAGNVVLQAGSTAIFSPSLVPSPSGAPGAITGAVLNALTGQPVSGAQIAVTGAFSATSQTQADGKYSITPLPTPGQITITVTAAGYQTVSASAVVKTDSLIDFSPKLLPAGGSVGTGKIHGVIVDAATGAPLPGVQVSANTRTATTDAAGAYLISDVAVGIVRIVASKTGYASASGEANMVANGLLEFSPRLTKASTGLTTSAIFGTVVSGRDGQPVADAEIYVSGTRSYSARTDASGDYRVDGLSAGNYSVTISHSGYTAATVNFDLPARTEMDFSPVLSDTVTTPVIIPNSATVSGRLLDSTTRKPIESATYRVESESRERGVNRFGRFNILGITTATVNVTFVAQGYQPVQARFPVSPLTQQDVGDVYMERTIAARLPDLAVASFDVSALSSHPGTGAVSGTIKVAVVNQGAQDTPSAIGLLAFEDVNRNGRFDSQDDRPVARAELTGGLAVGERKEVTLAVSATLRYRDAPLTLWVDSEQRVIELDEDNNIDRYGTSPQQAAKLYSSTAEFNEGRRINVAVNADGNALQLAENTRAFDSIWVANSGKGTVLRVDIKTGAVLGEYRSAPDGMGKNPSRTTVDKNGNVWVGNRNESAYVNANAIGQGLPATARGMGSIVKIGLLDNGQCEDRNGNGVIDTSTGLGDIKDWKNTAQVDSRGGVSTAQDECILAYTRVNSTGTRHISVDRKNQVWVSGTGGLHFDLVSETGEVIRQEVSVGWGGYGGLIDANDVIWSSTGGWGLLRWDTQNPLTGPSGSNWHGIGRASYGLCIDSRGNVWDSRGSVYRPDGTLLRTFGGGFQGCAVDNEDNVWVANGSNVTHYTSDGVLVGNVYTGATGGTTGLSTDANGKVWAVGGSRYVRIDPKAGPMGADGATRVGAIDVTGPQLGSGSYLYNYSDMTGSTLSGKPRQGTWTAIYDSGAAGTPWGMIDWHALVLGDGQLSVTVASSDDCTTFSAPAIVHSGQALSNVPNGRCLKVSVHFKRASTDESPVLYDLKIRPAVPDLTASRIQAVDSGSGRVGLQAFIGNASPFDAGAFDVAFWQGQPSAGGVLLGTVRVPGLAADHAIPVQLLGLTARQALLGKERAMKVGVGDEIVVHADGANVYIEYNETNNWVSAPLSERNILASLEVQTDRPLYGANAPVGFGATAANLGSYAAPFAMELFIEDAQGREVIRFPRTDLGNIAAAGKVNHGQPWNTGNTAAGNYVLRGLLYDATGTVVAEARTLFAIFSGTSQSAPLAGLTVSTDKGIYGRNDVVLLDTLARNLSLNTAIDGARVALQVKDALGQTVFSFEHPAAQLPRNGLIDQRARQTLRSAALGAYSVEARLLESRGQVLAVATARYSVIDGVAPDASIGMDVQGSTSLDASQVAAGQPLIRNDVVTNNGSTPQQGLRVIRVVASEDGREIHRVEQTVDLAPGETHRWPATTVPTTGLAPGRYFALMMIEVNGQLVLLDQAEFRVDGVTPPSEITAVPTTSAGGLALLALMVAVAAGTARKKTRRRANAAAARSSQEDAQ